MPPDVAWSWLGASYTVFTVTFISGVVVARFHYQTELRELGRRPYSPGTSDGWFFLALLALVSAGIAGLVVFAATPAQSPEPFTSAHILIASLLHGGLLAAIVWLNQDKVDGLGIGMYMVAVDAITAVLAALSAMGMTGMTGLRVIAWGTSGVPAIATLALFVLMLIVTGLVAVEENR